MPSERRTVCGDASDARGVSARSAARGHSAAIAWGFDGASPVPVRRVAARLLLTAQHHRLLLQSRGAVTGRHHPLRRTKSARSPVIERIVGDVGAHCDAGNAWHGSVNQVFPSQCEAGFLWIRTSSLAMAPAAPALVMCAASFAVWRTTPVPVRRVPPADRLRQRRTMTSSPPHCSTMRPAMEAGQRGSQVIHRLVAGQVSRPRRLVAQSRSPGDMCGTLPRHSFALRSAAPGGSASFGMWRS